MSEQSPETRAAKIAKAASGAWSRTQGSSDYPTPVGVIAALALTKRDNPAGPDPAPMLTAFSDEQIAGALTEIWALFGIARPELARLTEPLANWIHEDRPDMGKIHAIADVARAATQYGLLDLAGSPALRDTDVIGITYQQMRADAGLAPRWARGEFATPPSVCKVMAALALGGSESLKPGMSIAAGPAGTGEMLRAAAEHIRDQGLDPHGFWWIVNGVSPAAVAVTAVNCHLWGLGPRVVIGVADSITEPDWPDRAWAEQRAAIARRDAAGHAGATLAAAPRTAGAIQAGSCRAACLPGHDADRSAGHQRRVDCKPSQAGGQASPDQTTGPASAATPSQEAIGDDSSSRLRTPGTSRN